MLSAFILAVHSYSALHLAAQQIHQRYVQPGPLVLRSCPLNLLAPTTDRDRTVLRRSEPSSRATLIGEQPNPWDLLQPQDVTNRHRGAKPYRRYELLGKISLLSPEYLLSFERCPFHTETPDHFSQLSLLLDLFVSQSSTLLLMRSAYDYQPYWGYLCKPPLLFRRRPPQSNYPPCTVPRRGLGPKQQKVGISTLTPHHLAMTLHSLPTILHICGSKSMQSCSEGSRGLSVPWRVTGIFTDTTISPGSWRRQCSTH